MTVRELIELLKQYDEDMHVCVLSPEGYDCDVIKLYREMDEVIVDVEVVSNDEAKG